MRYKEFKKAIENWGKKYNYETEVKIDDFHTFVKVVTEKNDLVAVKINNMYMFTFETDWNYSTKIALLARSELFRILSEFAKTSPYYRKDEKRFIIPLPHLVTTDGKQQYLTQKDCNFFASRRNSQLRQTWKEEDWNHVPEIYRQFAIEFYEDREY